MLEAIGKTNSIQTHSWPLFVSPGLSLRENIRRVCGRVVEDVDEKSW